jgi:hypothetical protein
MAELRNTTNEFKATWGREVNFEEEAKALSIDDLDDNPPNITPPSSVHTEGVTAPEIKQIDATAFAANNETVLNGSSSNNTTNQAEDEKDVSEKQNWL